MWELPRLTIYVKKTYQYHVRNLWNLSSLSIPTAQFAPAAYGTRSTLIVSEFISLPLISHSVLPISTILHIFPKIITLKIKSVHVSCLHQSLSLGSHYLQWKVLNFLAFHARTFANGSVFVSNLISSCCPNVLHIPTSPIYCALQTFYALWLFLSCTKIYPFSSLSFLASPSEKLLEFYSSIKLHQPFILLYRYFLFPGCLLPAPTYVCRGITSKYITCTQIFVSGTASGRTQTKTSINRTVPHSSAFPFILHA